MHYCAFFLIPPLRGVPRRGGGCYREYCYLPLPAYRQAGNPPSAQGGHGAPRYSSPRFEAGLQGENLLSYELRELK